MTITPSKWLALPDKMWPHPKSRIPLRFMYLSLPLLFCTGYAFGQSQITGRIAGTVKDEKGAVIVGAEITAACEATGHERKVTTGKDGNYSVALLRPGAYRVNVSARGFNSVVFDPVNVTITETTTVNVDLPV